MRVRLILKQPYFWGVNRKYSSNIGFLQTDKQLKKGDHVRIEDLNHYTHAGDSSDEALSAHFMGKTYLAGDNNDLTEI